MDAGLVGELAHKAKHAGTASETTSLPEQKCFSGFCFISLAAPLLDGARCSISSKEKNLKRCLFIFFFAHLFVPLQKSFGI